MTSNLPPERPLAPRRAFLKQTLIGAAWAGGLAGAFSIKAAGADKVPLLFDTDIGDDIDDAVCLAYLLSQPRCELLGVTTEFGSNALRAQLVSALCLAAGRDHVPIHAGAPVGMNGKPFKRVPAQAKVLADWPHREDFVEGEAVDFLAETILARPHEITLLATGPLTNVGRLFQERPEVADQLAGLVLMNGQFKLPAPEWNALGDPLATRTVYETPLPSLMAVGLDVTMKCAIPAAEARRRFQGGALDLVAAMAEVWFTSAPAVIFHDPLAAATVFAPELCAWRDVKVRSRRGVTLANRFAPTRPHRIAVAVDRDAFFAHYFETVSGST